MRRIKIFGVDIYVWLGPPLMRQVSIFAFKKVLVIKPTRNELFSERTGLTPVTRFCGVTLVRHYGVRGCP